MASASSSVRSLRCSSSEVGWCPKLGSNFVAQIAFDPNASICSAKALFKPWIMDTMNIRVITPTLTPKIVSDERSLFAHTVSAAISADSLMSSSFIADCRLPIADLLLALSALNLVQLSLEQMPTRFFPLLIIITNRQSAMGNGLKPGTRYLRPALILLSTPQSDPV